MGQISFVRPRELLASYHRPSLIGINIGGCRATAAMAVVVVVVSISLREAKRHFGHTPLMVLRVPVSILYFFCHFLRIDLCIGSGWRRRLLGRLPSRVAQEAKE